MWLFVFVVCVCTSLPGVVCRVVLWPSRPPPLIGTHRSACPVTVPVNDNVTTATTLTSDSTGAGSLPGTNYDATLEDGEAATSGTLTASVWYTWTAPAVLAPFQLFRVDTVSTSTDFDTQVAVYSYSDSGGSGGGGPVSPTALTRLGGNDDCYSGTLASCVNEIAVTAGDVYYIQVGGYSGAPGTFAFGVGNFQLEWGFGTSVALCWS